MTTLRGGAHRIQASRFHMEARAVAIALAVALVIALGALAFAVADSGGGETDSVRVEPSPGSTPPSPDERKNLRGPWGPGAHP